MGRNWISDWGWEMDETRISMVIYCIVAILLLNTNENIIVYHDVDLILSQRQEDSTTILGAICDLKSEVPSYNNHFPLPPMITSSTSPSSCIATPKHPSQIHKTG